MRSDAPRAPLGLKLAAGLGLLFLHLPILLIFLYAFTTDERSYTFPPPGLTSKWFAVLEPARRLAGALALGSRRRGLDARRDDPRHARRRRDVRHPLLRPRGGFAARH